MSVSPYRHVYIESSKPDKSYQEVNVSTTSIDTNLLAANYRFVAVPWETRGGGLFTVLPVNGNGKIGTTAPMFTGHQAGVLDLAFNPFNDFIIASAADDATVRIWNIEMNGDKVKPQSESLAVLKGHSRRATRALWNPVVNNCLASFGAENSVKIWDVAHGKDVVTFKAGKDALLDLAWNQKGTLLAFPMKDKKLHLLDPRSNTETAVVDSHPGLRGSRAVFYDRLNFVVTTGFSASSQRQIIVRDYRNPEKALSTLDVDSNNGILAPFVDDDLGILTCFSRGDALIRFYELQSAEQPLVTLSATPTNESIRSFAQAPKYCVDPKVCEVDRFYSITSNKLLCQMQLIVPRKNADIFQEDLYPLTDAPESTVDFEQWKNGKDSEHKKISL